MYAVFADTCYWIALLNPKDQVHDAAVNVSRSLGEFSIVTTEEVLTEFLNYFGGRGTFLRNAAAKLVERMQADQSISIVRQSHENFVAGYRLYLNRPDKGYSLTDCISMEIMREKQLRDVLTNDEHFAQEGFNCLIQT